MTTDTHTAKCPRCGGPVPAPPPPLPPRYCERCMGDAKKEVAAMPAVAKTVTFIAKCFRCGVSIPYQPLHQRLPRYCPACARKVWEENARKIADIIEDNERIQAALKGGADSTGKES